METVTAFAFLGVCIGIGASLSIDVLFATLTRLQKKESFFDWAVIVSILHAVLPALAFTIAWTAGQLHDSAKVFVGLAGFILVALYLYEEFCDKTGIEARVALVEWVSKKLGVKRKAAGVFVLGTGVSIDSFLFGPTMVATMNQLNWSLTETYMAFVVIGLTVLTITLATLALPHIFKALAKRAGWHIADDVAIAHFWVDLAVFSVIGGFGVLSLWSITGQETNLVYSILVSAIFWSLLFAIFRKKLMKSECEEAKEVVG